MTPTEREELIDGYFSLRRDSNLAREDAPFEGAEWKQKDNVLLREANGYRLLTYFIENDIEVRVIDPWGVSKTFATPKDERQRETVGR